MPESVEYVHLNLAEKPRDGECLVERYWVFRAGKGIAFHRTPGTNFVSPQCNSNRRLVELLIKKLYPGHDIMLVPIVYLGRDGRCGASSRP